MIYIYIYDSDYFIFIEKNEVCLISVKKNVIYDGVFFHPKVIANVLIETHAFDKFNEL
jgi:hypothetical protein